MKEKIIIATIKSWNIDNAFKFRELYKNKYEVIILDDKDKFKKEIIDSINPKWIFYPHWSWLIPSEIYNKYNCVLFHITDLPFGRGGSPLQNLIFRRIYTTKISAIKVVKEIDAGSVYLKENFSIKNGSAGEIFNKASKIIFFKMIPFIIDKNPQPIEQMGEIVTFKRRKPEESELKLADFNSLKDFYDFVRMLDGEGYPKAFLKFNKFRMEFSKAQLKLNRLVGRFEITEEE
jgi:methionyl-tRNA formyltransferase